MEGEVEWESWTIVEINGVDRVAKMYERFGDFKCQWANH